MQQCFANDRRVSPPAGQGTRRVWATMLIAASSIALLSACSTLDFAEPAPPQNTKPLVTTNDLVGRWGLAAYHRDTDRDRTIREARSQCSNAYVIQRGPNGGVMMNLADEKERSELQVKAADGRTFIGREGPAGEATDMEVSAFDGTVMTIQWLDEDVISRYGTMVYVRCNAPAPKVNPTQAKRTG